MGDRGRLASPRHQHHSKTENERTEGGGEMCRASPEVDVVSADTQDIVTPAQASDPMDDARPPPPPPPPPHNESNTTNTTAFKKIYIGKILNPRQASGYHYLSSSGSVSWHTLEEGWRSSLSKVYQHINEDSLGVQLAANRLHVNFTSKESRSLSLSLDNPEKNIMCAGEDM